MAAENIKAAARRRRLGLNRLADFSGLNRPHLLRVASGQADATVGWLAKLANSLQVELRALFDPAVLETDRRAKAAKPKPAKAKTTKRPPAAGSHCAKRLARQR